MLELKVGMIVRIGMTYEETPLRFTIIGKITKTNKKSTVLKILNSTYLNVLGNVKQLKVPTDDLKRFGKETNTEGKALDGSDDNPIFPGWDTK